MPETAETEVQLVERAQQALNRCNWEIGECAARWTKKFARGRTDADFGALIGLSGDQVFQRRRVWETFSDVCGNYPALRWSHFYAAITWDDAAECLTWANDMQATVAEMKAWRRAQHGEDLTAPAADDAAGLALSTLELLPAGAGLVRDPDEFREADGTGNGRRESLRGRDAVQVGAAREAEAPGGDDYAPFGSAARGSAPTETDTSERPEASAETILKRVATALERCDAALTPDVLEAFGQAPIKVRRRILKAVADLQSKTAGLKV
jgi:hypothetical protein